MTKIDWMLKENDRILDEMERRTEVENKAFKLMAQGKFDEARELVETLDDSLLEIREWPGEEESEYTGINVGYTAKEATEKLKEMLQVSYTPVIEVIKQEEHYDSKVKKMELENKRIKKRITIIEKEIRCWRYETQILIEFCRSVANEKGMSLLSYQQLNSPTANSSKKVRMLFRKIRKFR